MGRNFRKKSAKTLTLQLPIKSWIWLAIGGYLTIVESMQMQGVSRHFYKFVTPNRLCHYKLELPIKPAFSYCRHNKHDHSIMLFDAASKEARLIVNHYLELEKAKTVFVKNTLIVLKEGTLGLAYKYTNF